MQVAGDVGRVTGGAPGAGQELRSPTYGVAGLDVLRRATRHRPGPRIPALVPRHAPCA